MSGRLANSALLAGLAFLIAVPLGLSLGVWVGTRVDTKIDRFLTMGGLVTISLPFDEWTEVFGSERLTGALLDRLTHHAHILEMNGESYRLKESRQAAELLSSD